MEENDWGKGYRSGRVDGMAEARLHLQLEAIKLRKLNSNEINTSLDALVKNFSLILKEYTDEKYAA